MKRLIVLFSGSALLFGQAALAVPPQAEANLEQRVCTRLNQGYTYGEVYAEIAYAVTANNPPISYRTVMGSTGQQIINEVETIGIMASGIKKYCPKFKSLIPDYN